MKHFDAEGYKWSSLLQIIKRSEDGISAERKVGSGTKAKIMIKGNITKLKWLKDHTDHISLKENWLKNSHQQKNQEEDYYQKKSKANIPKRTEAQISQAKACVFRMCKI